MHRSQLDELRSQLAECLQRQSQLRETEQHYERLVETMNEGLAMQDGGYRLTYVNEAFCRMLGYSRDELLQMHSYDVVFEPDRELYRSQLEKRKTGADEPYEMRFRRNDGSVMEAIVSPRPIMNEQGELTGSFAIVTDISSTRRTERQLMQEHQRLQDIIDFLPDATFVIDAEGRVLAWNKALEDMTGTSKSEIIGCGDYAYSMALYGERRPLLVDLIWQDDAAVRQYYGESFRRHDHRLVAETYVNCGHTNGGRYIWIIASPLYDEQGRVAGAIESIRDITSRKLAEQALSRERDLLSRVMATSPVGILLTGRDGLVTYANTRAEEILGRPRAELQGQACRDVWNLTNLDSNLLPGEQQLVGGLTAGEQTIYDRRLRIRHADGVEHVVSINFAPLLSESGEYDGAVTTFEDVTWRVETEQALRQREEDYRLLLESLSDMVLRTDPQGRVTFANQHFYDAFSTNEEALAGTSYMTFVHEQDRPAAEQAWQRLFEPPYRSEIEQRWLTRFGWRWFSWSSAAVLDKSGKVAAITGVGRDITHHREAEDALRESQRRMSTLLSNLPGMAYRCVNDSQWTMSYVSQGCLALTGYRAEQLQQSRDVSYADLIHPDDRRSVWHEVQTALAMGRQFNLTYRLLHADGHQRWVLEMGRAVESGEGQKEILEGFIMDVTDRIEAEAALRASRRRYQDLFETMHDAFAVLELVNGDDSSGPADFRFLEVNPAFERLWERSSQELIGRTMRQVLPQVDEQMMRSLAEIVETGKGRRFEFFSPVFSKTLEITAYRPQPGQLAKVIVDVSSRKQAEIERDKLRQQLLQAQKMEAIGTLAGGVAHDFNNLLTGILGYADMMKFQAPQGSDVREAAEAIENAARKAAQLTSQLLGFARGGKYQDIAFNVHSQIQDVMTLISRTFKKDIIVELSLEAKNPIVRGDPTQLQQVVLNLAVNARDAMPDGGRLSISTDEIVLDDEYCSAHHGVQPGRYLMIVVSDTGVGIPKEMQGRIFEPFFTTKKTGEGTGMGLAMVYGIVKNHGGAIQLYSEPGMGARFRVYLPSVESDEEMTARQEQPLVRGCGTILLVDDEEVVRSSVRRMLESLGYDVLTASDGDEAIELYSRRREEIVLVILDMVMPGMGGVSCLSRLRELDPAVKTIMSSGYSLDADLQAARREGVLDFIQKPFELARLSAVISEAIGKCDISAPDEPREEGADDADDGR